MPPRVVILRLTLQVKYFANRLIQNDGAAPQRYNERRDEKRLQ
jgi:hypothetical protein